MGEPWIYNVDQGRNEPVCLEPDAPLHDHSPPMSKWSSSTMATSSMTTDCWDPGALFSLSEELSDDEGNPELGPGSEGARAGTGIGMGDAPP